MNLNRVILSGRVGSAPEVVNFESGSSLTKFSMAVSKKVKGEDKTNWFQVKSWGKVAENVAKYLEKGQLCLVEGEINNRSYENKEGQKVWTTEIAARSVAFGPKSKNSSNNQEYQRPEGVENEAPTFDDQEEMPF